jgi:hypothetical protein
VGTTFLTTLIEGVAEENKSMGVARVGGPYALMNHFGQAVTQDSYAGRHTLVAFLITLNNFRFILGLRGVRIFVLKSWIRWRGLLIR